MNVFLFCISSLHKKRSFSLCISFAIVIADLLALTKERLNSKLNFLFNIGTLFGGNAAHEDSQKKKKKIAREITDAVIRMCSLKKFS